MSGSANVPVTDEHVADYRADGVVVVRGVLDPPMLKEAERVFQWSINHPSPAAQCYKGGSDGAVFYQDLFNTKAWAEYRTLYTRSAMPDVLQRLWGCDEVWFFFEQVFLKKGGATRRTPWHQDTSYFPIDGEHLAVIWLCLDEVRQEDSLEFVRGSHRRTIYNGSSFSETDDTAPLYPEEAMPRLPDIERERERWDIVSWAVSPGDAIIFHPSTLHGGARTYPGTQRRTLSMRYFGSDVKFVERPQVRKESEVGFNREAGDSRNIEEFYEGLRPGDPFRNPGFEKVRPHA